MCFFQIQKHLLWDNTSRDCCCKRGRVIVGMPTVLWKLVSCVTLLGCCFSSTNGMAYWRTSLSPCWEATTADAEQGLHSSKISQTELYLMGFTIPMLVFPKNCTTWTILIGDNSQYQETNCFLINLYEFIHFYQLAFPHWDTVKKSRFLPWRSVAVSLQGRVAGWGSPTSRPSTVWWVADTLSHPEPSIARRRWTEGSPSAETEPHLPENGI